MRRRPIAQMVALAMVAAGGWALCSLANAEALSMAWGMVAGLLAGWPAALLWQREGAHRCPPERTGRATRGEEREDGQR